MMRSFIAVGKGFQGSISNTFGLVTVEPAILVTLGVPLDIAARALPIQAVDCAPLQF
jgi:hypothetical protein